MTTRTPSAISTAALTLTSHQPSFIAVVLRITLVALLTFEVVDGLEMSMMTKQSRFITNKMCPFAQKAWIALELSKTPYKLEEISLYGAGGKPDWFWKLNPQGTVPVLVAGIDGDATTGTANDDTTVLADSDLILDYLQDKITTDQNNCENDDNNNINDNIIIRTEWWRKEINRMLPIGKAAVQGNRQKGKELMQILQHWEDKIADNYRTDMDTTTVATITSLCGSSSTGHAFTVADCAAFPFLWRIHDSYTELDRVRFPKLKSWLKHCESQPEFAKTIQSAWWWWW